MLQPEVNFVPGKDWIYYSGPNWDSCEIEAGCKALREGKWIPSGEQVQRFERAFSKKFDFAESLMVNSGSSANLVMLAALKKYYGWVDGAEIIVSPVGFPTTIAPIVQNNMKPIFVDIEWDTLNFDLTEVAKAVTAKTAAIFLSPVLGNPPDMDLLEHLPIPYILDGCDSLGSKWDRKKLSINALATSCSFYPAHHITTGEGGMVSSCDKYLIKIAKQFAHWGRDCWCVGAANQLPCGTCGKRFGDWLGDGSVIDHKYVFSQMGYNLKPLDLQGAIGLEQLKKFDWIHTKRRSHKQQIGYWLKRIPGVRVIDELPLAETSWFGVPVVCETATLKTHLVAYLEDNKIQTRNYFAGNILKHPGYRHLGEAADYPNANEVLSRVFFIGCHPGYSAEQLTYITDTIVNFPGVK
jgi:CDP-6-deoxy-D-xylo-4-hexulose-3-dehydrase